MTSDETAALSPGENLSAAVTTVAIMVDLVRDHFGMTKEQCLRCVDAAWGVNVWIPKERLNAN